MGEWHEIPQILKLTAADITVWLLTLTLTVVADLTFAVEIGMVLAALTFIRKVSRTTTVTRHARLCRRQPPSTSCKAKIFPNT
jgi:SulP family sulfate permease